MVQYEENTVDTVVNPHLGVWENMHTHKTYFVWNPGVVGIINGETISMVFFYTNRSKTETGLYVMPQKEFYEKFKRVEGSYRK